jgi:hypothetical protein
VSAELFAKHLTTTALAELFAKHYKEGIYSKEGDTQPQEGS